MGEKDRKGEETVTHNHNHLRTGDYIITLTGEKGKNGGERGGKGRERERKRGKEVEREEKKGRERKREREGWQDTQSGSITHGI